MNARRAGSGFTLIELMVSMVIGLLVIGMAATSFRGHARSADLGQSLVEMQARARFVLDEIATGVRAAGFIGCASAGQVIPALPPRLGSSGESRASWRPVDGFVVASGAWRPANPAGYGSGGYAPPASGPAAPVPGSDALLVEGGVGPGSALAGAMTSGPTIELRGTARGLARGTMGLIADCSGAEGFVVKSVTVRADGTSRVRPDKPFGSAHAIDPDYPLGSRVLPYRRALYFVGDTGRVTRAGESIRALYEHLHPFVDTAPAELANGVEAMVVRYRQRAANGAVRELAADAADFDPDLVVGVRVGLLLSDDGYRTRADERPAFVLAGQTVGTTGSGPAHPDDSRMRRTFERSAAIRARNAVEVTP